jgi:hypothetical protein
VSAQIDFLFSKRKINLNPNAFFHVENCYVFEGSSLKGVQKTRKGCFDQILMLWTAWFSRWFFREMWVSKPPKLRKVLIQGAFRSKK